MLTSEGMVFGSDVAETFSELYRGGEFSERIGEIAALYASHLQRRMYAAALPTELEPFTSVRSISEGIAPAVTDRPLMLERQLGIVHPAEPVIRGPLVGILFRYAMLPMYLGRFAEAREHMSPEERAKYNDPPILQNDEALNALLEEWVFKDAAGRMSEPEAFSRVFRRVGELADHARREFEEHYATRSSTQAYEAFGAAHLFPETRANRVTATSPGAILPAEADPLAYVGRVVDLETNLGRAAYFRLMRLGAETAGRRRYLASIDGTRKDLRRYPELAEDAKRLLQGWLDLGTDRFELRIGTPDPALRNVTFVTDWGLVLSVRGEEKKIARNVTVTDHEAAKGYKKRFDASFAQARPVTDVSVVDDLIAGA